MAQTTASIHEKQSVRDIDPNVLQQRASQPDMSVWVGASAGSGKTKVLTDRVLRLLLPSSKGQNATAPHKILALTFTKAAASEMALRINKCLSTWAITDDNSLKEELKNLLGYDATEKQLDSARKLFAQVVDTPGGLKIMTIHSFCQSILSRFPLEADLPPQFHALEEAQSQKIRQRAIEITLKKAEEEKGTPLYDAVQHIAAIQNDDQFYQLISQIVSERRQFEHLLETHFDIDGLYTTLCQSLGIPAGQGIEEIQHHAFQSAYFDENGLRQCCSFLAGSSKKTDQNKAIEIQKWLDQEPKERMVSYSSYKSCFLKQDGEILSRLATKETTDKHPKCLEILSNEATRLLNLENQLNSIRVVTATRDLFLISKNILDQYKGIKNAESMLDFDDLILRTLALLQGKTNSLKGLKAAPWVRFKLDQGIDHILVDEAQDTNPEQWEIIQALCDDFFDSGLDTEIERTVFVVGDEKQSIFSFQRASPKKFDEMRQWFSSKISNAQKNFIPVDFNISFRSVRSVLELVDCVFENPNTLKGVSKTPTAHQSYRRGQPGLVELWPIFKNPEKEKTDPWEPPINIVESTTGAVQMANHIGETIANWINSEERLESHNRPIKAGDIMVLVRSRTAFIDQLVRALKTRNIPVSGVDRMILSDQLVVQDLCAAAQFSLLPEDDLNLAGFLKSPFIGWDDNQLFNIAHDRKGSLWQAVKESNDPNVINFLSQLIERVGSHTPYDFFVELLQEECPAHKQSGLQAIKTRLGEESLDPLDEFLNTALSFERENIATLQNFIQAQLYDESQIKREMEEAGNAVRIMTAHGAKGLQAPIVILPDTMRNASAVKSPKILWPDRSGQPLPYFCPSTKTAPNLCKEAINHAKELDHEEYRRLLYVALTRAENRLYIGGYQSQKPPITESWYHYIADAFKKLSDVEEIDFDDKKILRYRNVGTNEEADRAKKETNDNKKTSNEIKIPDWLFKPMPEEPFPPKPLSPSRPSENEVATLSPLKAQDDYRFLRGNVTHKLLQILPDIPQEKWESAAQNYIKQQDARLSDQIRQDIIRETLTILSHPDFKAIFGPKSMAEVPVTGMMDDQTLISGQIDRLLVTDHEILIIDYKTNRPPPQKEENVPPIYKRQMQCYADIMRKIYPDRKVKGALIWTDGARLMELTDL